jgi:phosphoribosyl-AMP cyclohydrolase / phosphoribosyl-ATP pyrophosphohydrolase
MTIDFSKYTDGLAPAIVQDAATGKVLMLGFMNAEALEATLTNGKATFYSRSKQRLWVKGETSGNFLLVKEILADCDADTLLVKATPLGPVCHTGSDTCFGEENTNAISFLQQLEQVIVQRQHDLPESSYTASLFKKGINAVAQKVGEEAVELIIEAKDNDTPKFLGEAADLLYHYLVLLRAKGHSLADVAEVLKLRG